MGSNFVLLADELDFMVSEYYYTDDFGPTNLTINKSDGSKEVVSANKYKARSVPTYLTDKFDNLIGLSATYGLSSFTMLKHDRGNKQHVCLNLNPMASKLTLDQQLVGRFDRFLPVESDKFTTIKEECNYWL